MAKCSLWSKLGVLYYLMWFFWSGLVMSASSFAEIMHLICRFLVAAKTGRKCLHSWVELSKAGAWALISFHLAEMAAKGNAQDNKIETQESSKENQKWCPQSGTQGQPVAAGLRIPVRETSLAPCFQLNINSWYLGELAKNNCTVPPEPSALSHHHIMERGASFSTEREITWVLFIYQ